VPVEVVDDDGSWPTRFAALREEYAAAFARAGVPVVAIEHVGSTSVPGLAAKPILDIDIVVAGGDVEAASAVLAGLGFEPRGDLGIPDRWAFVAPERLGATHTYVVADDSLALRNHLAVRTALRSDAALRDEYAAIKRAAGAAADDIEDYLAAKNATIQRILDAGGLTDAERAEIDGQQ
jgi:GrpB-like predicted nucleotidyltransferase (UPF0157 family)